MKHKHTLRKIRVNRILNKVDKESTKIYRIEPIASASANEEGVDSASIKYWKGLNELINKGTQS